MQYADVTTRLAGLGSDKWVLSAAANARIRAGEAGEGARGVWVAVVTADTQAGTREALFAAG